VERIKVCFLGNWYIASQILEVLATDYYVNIDTVITTVRENDKYSRLVFSQAKKYDIKVINTNEADWRNYLKTNSFDLLISVSFDYILKKEHYKNAKYGAINLHQSLLPLYRGRDPVVNAIINGDDKIGFTIHFIDEGIDTGNIIYQAFWPLSELDTIESINKKMALFSKKIFIDIIREIVIKDKSVGIIQTGYSTYASKIKPIDWDTTVKEIRKAYL